MELGLNQILSLLIVFVSLLLAAFLFTLRSVKYTSNLLLGLFLVICAVDADAVFLGNYLYPVHPDLGVFISTTVLFKVVLIYLYILSVIYADFRLKWKHLFHAIPFLFVNVSLIPNFYSQDFQGQMNYLQSDNFLLSQPEIKISYIMLHFQLFVYIIAGFIVIDRYRRLLLENYSNASFFHYKWLFQLILVFSTTALIASLKNLFLVLDMEKAHAIGLRFTSLLVLGYIIWMVFRAMRNPELFKGIDSQLQLVSRMVKEETHSITVGREQKDPEIDKKLTLLNTFMTEQEPFLDPSLSIYDLSKKTNIPTKDLSLLINHDLNQHFFDFVNGFRIRKAMEILKDPRKKELTVLEILYDVGFNSKSSFNTAFKKQTRLTPTEYRKKHLLSAA